jgi:hypothetical protein
VTCLQQCHWSSGERVADCYVGHRREDDPHTPLDSLVRRCGNFRRPVGARSQGHQDHGRRSDQGHPVKVGTVGSGVAVERRLARVTL